MVSEKDKIYRTEQNRTEQDNCLFVEFDFDYEHSFPMVPNYEKSS